MTSYNDVQLDRELSDASRRKLWPFFWAMIGTVMVVLSYIGYNHWNYPQDVMTIVFLFGTVIIMSATWFLNVAIWDYHDLKALEGDKPEPPRKTQPPPRDITNLLNYQQFNPGTPVVVPSEDKDNVLYKCKWRFEPAEWLRLVRQLSINADGQGRWKWTKSALKKADLFNATMTPGVSIDNTKDYPVICAEFVRLGVIEGRMGKWRVTRPGMVALSRAANLNVVPGRG